VVELAQRHGGLTHDRRASPSGWNGAWR
jgi:hypothetical protein